MSPTDALTLLERFRNGQVPAEQVLHAFQAAPVVDLGFAAVDQHRALRKGFPEVIFGAGKTPEQVVAHPRRAASTATTARGGRKSRNVDRSTGTPLDGMVRIIGQADDGSTTRSVTRSDVSPGEGGPVDPPLFLGTDHSLPWFFTRYSTSAGT